MEETDAYMQQHFVTSPDGSVTDTSCYETSSEDGGGGSPWFGMNSISSFARSLGQNIDGIASAVNRGARVLINELAELENEAMRSDGEGSSVGSCSNEAMESSVEVAVLPLPWEVCMQSTCTDDMNVSIEQTVDDVLKERILSLSTNDEVFTQPFVDANKVSDSFCLDDARVVLIRRLLEIDTNLGKVHAKISGRSEIKETNFWQNYFFHCEKIREERQNEINDECRRRSSHDDELDAEIVGCPPASCTGFYPRTGKLQDLSSTDGNISRMEEELTTPTIKRIESYDSEGFVLIGDEDVA